MMTIQYRYVKEVNLYENFNVDVLKTVMYLLYYADTYRVNWLVILIFSNVYTGLNIYNYFNDDGFEAIKVWIGLV